MMICVCPEKKIVYDLFPSLLLIAKKPSHSGGKIKINRFSALKGGISNLFEFFAETKRNPALKNWKEVLGAKKNCLDFC